MQTETKVVKLNGVERGLIAQGADLADLADSPNLAIAFGRLGKLKFVQVADGRIQATEAGREALKAQPASVPTEVPAAVIERREKAAKAGLTFFTDAEPVSEAKMSELRLAAKQAQLAWNEAVLAWYPTHVGQAEKVEKMRKEVAELTA